MKGLVYHDSDGEKDPGIAHDGRRSLGRALRWADHDRSGDGRASATDFFDWAAQQGLALDPEAFSSWLRARREIAAGSEHTIHADQPSQRVVKLSHPDLIGDGAIGQHTTAVSYLRNMDMANRLLDDDQQLEGIVQQDGEFPQIVISQPFIRGARKASPDEIDQYFAGKAFLRQTDGSYYQPQLQVRASDTVGENVLARDTGEGVTVHPIDVQLRYEGTNYPASMAR